MIHIIALTGFAIFYASRGSATPLPDSAIGTEVGASAPNGIPVSDTMMESNPHGSHGWTQTYSSPSYMTSPPLNSQPWSPSYSLSVQNQSSTSPCVTTPSSSATSPVSTPYGSGSTDWGSGFDNCVQQCQAKFGAPSASKPTPAMSTGGPSGGATRTVWVAPTQGVLRYVPFAVNASVGDTVKFIWGGTNHTVTKSSVLTPCNKTSDAPFTSGVQPKGFVFEQVVNNTNPLFFYCGVPNHCQKGMFGIINPPNAMGNSTSVGSIMQPLASNNSQFNSMLNYAKNTTAGNPVANLWGQNIDLSSLPSWAHQSVAEGVLYTQTFLASNPNAVRQDGSIDFGLGGSTPTVPQDITMFASGYGGTPSTPSSVPAPSPITSSAGPPTITASSGNVNGAMSGVLHSSVPVGFIVLAVGLLL